MNKRIEKPKVVVFSAGKPPIGSWHQRIRMFSIGFLAHGYDLVHIVPYYPPTLEALDASPAYIKYSLKVVKRRKRGFSVMFTAITGVCNAARYLMNLNNVKFVLVPGLNFLQGIAVLIVARRKKIPFYAEIADESTHVYNEGKRYTYFDIIAKYNQLVYEKFVLKHADRIYVFSSYLKNKYEKMFPMHSFIQLSIPSLIDLDDYDRLALSNIQNIKQKNIELLYSACPKIVYAGACNRPNGLFFFLDAVSRIKKELGIKFYIFFFFVYGEVEKIKSYCRQLDLDENVNIFTPVQPMYIPAIYSYADILLLPEQGDVIANAGFPGKTSELLASGKAIISTNFSDLKLYLRNGENAMISNIGNFDEYSANLTRLLCDPELRRRLGESARITANNYFNCINGVKRYL